MSQRVKDALRDADLAIDAVAKLQEVTQIGGLPATIIVETIGKIVHEVSRVLDGTISADVGKLRVEKMVETLKSNDDEIDEDIRKLRDSKPEM